jgi:hypothetical protein
MARAVSAPIRELLDWIALRPRSYADTMATWTTHCPRLSTWEGALECGLVEVVRDNGGSAVRLTAAGRATLDR